MAKIGKRILGAAGVGLLVASVGALAACSGSDKGGEGTPEAAKAALTNANVTITMLDAKGVQVGTGTGVLIAPNTVLTAGHLVAGYSSWRVTSADGKVVAMGKRGLTKDWMAYDSMKSHPRKTDVGVLYLNKAIKLAAYPKLAQTRQGDGGSLQRVSHTNKGFQMIDGKISHFASFSHAYITDIPTNETLDTGGPVINAKGEIIGVVTGRGIQTGKLHIARTDGLVKWLAPKVTCGGGGAALTVKTYGTPPPKADCTDDAGNPTTSSSSSSSGGDDTTGDDDDTTSSSSSSSSGGDNPGDNPGDKCTDTDGNCTGDGCDTSNSNPPTDTPTDTTSSSSSSTGGETPPNTSSSGGLSSGDDNPTTSSSSSSSGGEEPTTSSSSSSSSSGGDQPPPDKCQGPTDNPDTCPPEPTGCTGPNCGGVKPPSTSNGDELVDYGNASTSSSTTGPSVVH